MVCDREKLVEDLFSFVSQEMMGVGVALFVLSQLKRRKSAEFLCLFSCMFSLPACFKTNIFSSFHQIMKRDIFESLSMLLFRWILFLPLFYSNALELRPVKIALFDTGYDLYPTANDSWSGPSWVMLQDILTMSNITPIYVDGHLEKKVHLANESLGDFDSCIRLIPLKHVDVCPMELYVTKSRMVHADYIYPHLFQSSPPNAFIIRNQQEQWSHKNSFKILKVFDRWIWSGLVVCFFAIPMVCCGIYFLMEREEGFGRLQVYSDLLRHVLAHTFMQSDSVGRMESKSWRLLLECFLKSVLFQKTVSS